MTKKTQQGFVLSEQYQKKLVVVGVVFLVLQVLVNSSFLGMSYLHSYLWLILGITAVVLFGKKILFPLALSTLIVVVYSSVTGLRVIAEDAANLMYLFLVLGIMSAFFDYLRSLKHPD